MRDGPWDKRPWYRHWGFDEWFCLVAGVAVVVCTAVNYAVLGEAT